jgi:hypothetical protein
MAVASLLTLMLMADDDRKLTPLLRHSTGTCVACWGGYRVMQHPVASILARQLPHIHQHKPAVRRDTDWQYILTEQGHIICADRPVSSMPASCLAVILSHHSCAVS